MEQTSYLKASLTAFSFALIGLVANAQKKIELKFSPENGSRYAMSTTTKSVFTQMGMDMNMNMGMDMDAAISRQGADKLMTLRYTNITLDMDMMGQKVNMSSNGTDKGSETLKKLTTKTFGCVIDKNGKIVRVTGLDSLISSISAGNPEANYFSEDAVKSMIEQSFSFYPNHPIEVGDSWMTKLDITSTVKMKANITYTLEKVENKLAYLKITSDMATDSTQKMKVNGTELEMTIGGTQNGEMVVDTQTGMYTTSHLVQDLKGSVSVMGQNIPMTIKSDVASTCTKK